MGNPSGLFWGMVFWGSEHLPGDVVLTLNEIRRWAFDQGLIADPDSQHFCPPLARRVNGATLDCYFSYIYFYRYDFL